MKLASNLTKYFILFIFKNARIPIHTLHGISFNALFRTNESAIHRK